MAARQTEDNSRGDGRVAASRVGIRNETSIDGSGSGWSVTQRPPPDEPQKFMSRIPVPSHSPSNHRGAGAQRAVSPVPFPDRSASPLPGGLQRHQTQASMSSVSSSMAETRKKQSKRDEVSTCWFRYASASLFPRHATCFYGRGTYTCVQHQAFSTLSCHVAAPQLVSPSPHHGHLASPTYSLCVLLRLSVRR